jgi:integrase
MGVRQFHSKRLGRKVWGYDAYVSGRRVKKIGFSTRDAAVEALARRRIREVEREAGVGVEKQAGKVVTVREVVERRRQQLRAAAKGSRGYSSRRQAARELLRFLGWLADPDMPVTSLQTSHLAAFRDALLGQGLQPQSALNLIAHVTSALNRAHETFPSLEGWRPPARPRFDFRRGKRKVIYDPGTAASLLAHLRRPRAAGHDHYKTGEPARCHRTRLDAADYFQAALQTGMRGAEVRSRAWSDVLWHLGAIRVDNTKAGDEGLVYVPASLIEMLRARRERQSPPSPWVFPSPADPSAHARVGFAKHIRRAAEELKIPWGYGERGGVVFHTTRHTAATTMLDQGADLATVQAQLGWSDRTMLLNYGHATTRSRRAAVSALDVFAGGGPTKVSGSDSTQRPDTPAIPHIPHTRGGAGRARKAGKLKKIKKPLE